MQSIFLMMIAIAVGMLTFAMVVPVFGEAKKTRKRITSRLRQVADQSRRTETIRLLREQHLKQLSPLERWLESLPYMDDLEDILRQAGYQTFAYRWVFLVVLAIATAFLVVLTLTSNVLWAAGAAVLALALTCAKVLRDRSQRMAAFEEQLPDAIDVMRRAMQAGHPFVESLKLVGQEMDGPVGVEFSNVFNDISYGSDVRTALLAMLERMPSVTVMALVTSTLIQKDTGGNLAEVYEKISLVIRERFKFQRRVKTLSAEGRMSGWILTLTPFILFAIVSLTTPSYTETLITDPLGRELIMWAFGLMLIGIYWMSRIIRIEV